MLIRSQDGRVLVVRKRGYGTDTVRLPTGGRQDAESPEGAFRREAAEEFGFVPGSVERLAKVAYADSDFTSYVLITTTEPDRILLPVGGENDEAFFVPLTSLPMIADKLESLPVAARSSAGEAGTWREWGIYRGAMLRAVHEILAISPIPLPPPDIFELRVLGPVQLVHADGTTQHISGRKAQILALLALSAPQEVARSELDVHVWSGEGHETDINDEVCRLRDDLGLSKDRHLVTNGDAYALNAQFMDTDVVHFTAKIREAAEAESERDTERQVSALTDALALWRGTFAGGVLNGSFHNRVERLNEDYLSAQECLFRAQLELGRHHAVIPLADAFVRDNALREDGWHSLVLALYRAGRESEAQVRLRHCTDLIRQETGKAPQERLRRLYEQIMRHDPELDLPRRRSFSGEGKADGEELVMYWGYRPAAHHDIKSTLLLCRTRLDIAGIGLSTVLDILNDPVVIRALARSARENPDFRIRLAMAALPLPTRQTEDGGRSIHEKVRLGIAQLEKFVGRFNELVGPERRDAIQLRSYIPGFTPRHFFLECDNITYVGSYLSHQQGSHSYLMKLVDNKDGLFELFLKELEYVMQNTTTLTDAEGKDNG